MSRPNLFVLAADNRPQLITWLQNEPSVASSQDEHGYSLLHAAASYNHHDLARRLVRDFHVDVNIKDEDGESPLFSTESVEAAKLLVEELSCDFTLRNHEGLTAQAKIADDGDFPLVAAYLLQKEQEPNSPPAEASASDGTGDPTRPPPLPQGVSINLETVEQTDVEQEIVDPDLKARIEALAQRDDFEGDEGQRQLRELISDAVKGHVTGETQERDVRSRTAM